MITVTLSLGLRLSYEVERREAKIQVLTETRRFSTFNVNSHTMRPNATIRKLVDHTIKDQQRERNSKVPFEIVEEAVAFIESFAHRPEAKRVRRRAVVAQVRK